MKIKLFTIVLLVCNAPLFIYIQLVPILHQLCAKYLLHSGVQNQSEFDFVVVGAGSAGSVVAGRLAEKGYTVLLLEAGGQANWFMTIPQLGTLFQKTPYDWQYTTVSQQHGQFNYLQGKFTLK